MLLLPALAAALPAQEPGPAPGPEGAGPQSERIAGLVRRLGTDDRLEAAVELYRIGAPAVAEIARRLAVGWPESDDEEAAWRAALSVLEHLGPGAEPAYDTLLASLQDRSLKSLRDEIFSVLGRTAAYDAERAGQVSKTLGNECDKGEYFGSTGFFELLSRLEYAADVDLTELVDRLTHDNPYVRELAAEAIARRQGEIRGDPALRERVIAALREAIEGEHPDKFNLSWEWNGGRARTQGHANNQDRIRTAAAMALSFFEPGDPLAVAGLRARLRHIDPMAQVEAVRALGAHGEEAAAATPDLAAMLTEARPLAAREAATALGMIGPAARSAVPELEKAAAGEDEQLAARARAALRQIDG